MTAARLVVWRHGRTPWNVENRFQGQADIGLDDVGRGQAARAAVALAALEPAVLWSSDLSRARDTAGALADLTGLPVRTDRRLREIHVGSWEGLTAAEVEERYPDGWARFQNGERGHDGETHEDHSLRVVEAVRRIAHEHPDEEILIVSHGGSLRAVQRAVLGLAPEGHDPRLRPIGNCVTLEIALREGRLRSVD